MRKRVTSKPKGAVAHPIVYSNSCPLDGLNFQVVENHSEEAEEQQFLCSYGGCIHSWCWQEPKDQGAASGAKKNQETFSGLMGLK